MDDEDKVPDFETWKSKVEAMLPWPSQWDIIEAIDSSGVDRAEDRILLLRDLVEAHYSGSDMGVFNDE